MSGITSLIAQEHQEQILAIMAALSQDFGVETHGWPHISYHVAAAYRDGLHAELSLLSAGSSPFTIQTAGLGIFTSPEPILYLTVVRDPALAALHGIVWALGEIYGQRAITYYRPDLWVPHISLARVPAGNGNLPAIIAHLGHQDLNWQLPIDNFALLGDIDAAIGMEQSWTLTG